MEISWEEKVGGGYEREVCFKGPGRVETTFSPGPFLCLGEPKQVTGNPQGQHPPSEELTAAYCFDSFIIGN